MSFRRTRIKICGITRRDDALRAADYGADALGFVFVPQSRRYITPEAAWRIAAELPGFVTIVGLFLDTDFEEVRHALAAVPALVPQFHGQETPEYCERFGVRYIKALAAQAAGDSAAAGYVSASGFLFDSHAPGSLGGTGHTFDWSCLPQDARFPLILAGGLGVHNVGAAIEQVRPWAVDVSSGVEHDKGRKSAVLLRDFMAAVRRADTQTDPVMPAAANRGSNDGIDRLIDHD